MTEISERQEASLILADALLDNGALSQAQIDLAIADQEINDIPLEEILLVRGWITEDKLYAVAPWLKPGSKEKPPTRKQEAIDNQSLTRAIPAVKEIEAASAAMSAAAAAAGASNSGGFSAAAGGQAAATQSKPLSTSGGHEAVASKPADTSGTAGGAAASKPQQPKPVDLPKEPPQRPAGEPVVHVSPVSSDNEQNLKAYKEVLKKILAVESD